MKQLHKTQRAILYKLLFSPGLRYTQMKPSKLLANNKFDFHLDQLMKMELIEHKETLYSLTNKGKEYTNRIDKEEKTLNSQAKLGVLVSCRRNKGPEEDYLIFTRLKQPFYGCQGFMTGKIKFGETVIDTAKRELQEETKLCGEPILVTVYHYRVFEKLSKKLVEDKFMFLCIVENPTGKLRANNEGKFEWMKRKNFSKITKHFVSLEDLNGHISHINSYDGKVQFIEEDVYTEQF